MDHQLAYCFFLLFAVLACGFAVAVVVSSNIVRMACCLVVSLDGRGGLVLPGRGRVRRRRCN